MILGQFDLHFPFNLFTFIMTVVKKRKIYRKLV